MQGEAEMGMFLYQAQKRLIAVLPPLAIDSVKVSQRLVVVDGKKQVDRFHPGAFVRFIIATRGYS